LTIRVLTSLRSCATSCCSASSEDITSEQPAAPHTRMKNRGRVRKGSIALPFRVDSIIDFTTRSRLLRPRRQDDSVSCREPRLLSLGQEPVVPIFGPARLGVLRANRALLAVGDDRDAARLDTLGHEVVHRRFRAALAESQIVLGGASLVAVTLDQ